MRFDYLAWQIFYLPFLIHYLWFWTKRYFIGIRALSDFFHFCGISVGGFDCTRGCSWCRIVGFLIFVLITWPFKIRSVLLYVETKIACCLKWLYLFLRVKSFAKRDENSLYSPYYYINFSIYGTWRYNDYI